MDDATGHDIIVIGASAGGVEALSTLVRRLPSDLPAAVFVVLHMSPQAPSALPRILSRAGHLPAVAARDGEPIRSGRIYVAVPDCHLLVEKGRVRVVRGPKENRSRPAIDPLFRTAALAYGPRVVGVVLSGSLDDGTAGLHAIKRRGGIAVVQDPDDALVASMPASAIAYVKVDYVMPVASIPAILDELARTPAPEEGAYPVPEDMKIEAELAQMDGQAMESGVPTGSPTKFTCPDCRGPLWEIQDGKLLRFRCSSGHAYTAETLVAGQSEEVEEALWTALTTLRESAKGRSVWRLARASATTLTSPSGWSAGRRNAGVTWRCCASCWSTAANRTISIQRGLSNRGGASGSRDIRRVFGCAGDDREARWRGSELSAGMLDRAVLRRRGEDEHTRRQRADR